MLSSQFNLPNDHSGQHIPTETKITSTSSYQACKSVKGHSGEHIPAETKITKTSSHQACKSVKGNC